MRPTPITTTTTTTTTTTGLPTTAVENNHQKPTIIYTTPPHYAPRVSKLLTQKALTPLWSPTITTTTTPKTLTSLSLHLTPSSLSILSAIAFPSRAAISASSAAAAAAPPSSTSTFPRALTLAALGKDSELLTPDFIASLCGDVSKVRILVPEESTPSGLVRALGSGCGRRVLCPVPKFIGVEEPLVVGEFIREFEEFGWVPVRVDAYETQWLGPGCVEKVVRREGAVDGVLFTSAAEVEGFLKGLRNFGWDWGTLRRRWPEIVVAVHGPVTARGAERLGVDVDVVSERFLSFEGVVYALCDKLKERGLL